ncbi:MAG: hypothetical protein LBJ01_12295, partial [Tannerella sp.]|nr:hypothetical protein [Tannerella sp.]
MQPVLLKTWEKLIEWLKKTGLARNVITDKTKMREYLEKNQEARKQSLPTVEDATEEQIQVNGNWYSRTVYPGWEALKVGDEVSGLNTKQTQVNAKTPVDNKLIEAAKNEFGTTDDFGEAGYMLPDGTMLDFSEKRNGGNPGMRSMDHRDISGIGDEIGADVDLVSFMAMGNIRLSPESGGFEITGKPSADQIRTLKRYIRFFDGNVMVDFSTPGNYNTEHSVEYYHAHPERVINDIINYYENGIKPITGLRLMSTPKGEVYGFVTPEGDIYLDPDKMNANTPIHEFGHLWNDFIKDSNPELWKKGAALIKNSPYWKQVDDNPAYAGLSEEQKVDEALAMAIGDKGESMANGGDILGFAQIRAWLNNVWKWIKEHLFGMDPKNSLDIERMTLDDFTGHAVGELTGGKEITSSRSQQNDQTGAQSKTEYASQSDYDFDVSGITEANAQEMKRIRAEAQEDEDVSREDRIFLYDNLGANESETSSESGEHSPENKETQPFFNGDIIDFAGRMAEWNKKNLEDKDKNNNFEQKTSTDGTEISKQFSQGTSGGRIKTDNSMGKTASDNRASESATNDVRQAASHQGSKNGRKRLDNSETNDTFAENNNVNNETSVSDRSAQTQQRGGNETHSRIEEVANELRNGTGANASKLSRPEREDAEKQIAFDYAKEKGLWIDDLYSLGRPHQGGGNENTLIYNADEGVIYKSNNLFNSQNSISQLLESIGKHNELFPETRYELVGFTGIDGGANRAPYVEPVLKQDYVVDAEQASAREISDYMQSLGFEQVNDHTFTDGKYTVSDLRPRNVLKDKNGTVYVVDDIISLNRETEREETGDIRFQTLPSQPSAQSSPTPSVEADRRELDRKINTLAFRLREVYEDNYLAVKKFLDLLREKGVEIKDHNDFYLQAASLPGKYDAQLEFYNSHYHQPMDEAANRIVAKGFSLRDMENYIILKHGPERNVVMTQRDISEGKTPRTDYAGVLAVEKEVGRSAQDCVADFEARAGTALIDEFWKRARAANRFSLEKMLEAGLIDKKMFDELTTRYKYFMPLRGHDAITAADMWNYATVGAGLSSPLTRADGRTSRSETPIAYVAQNAQIAIALANKNALKQTLLRLSRLDKTGLLIASRTWYVNGEAQEAEYSDSPGIYRKNIEKFEAEMEAKGKKGLAERKAGRLDTGGMFITPAQKAQHAIHVFQNGTSYTLYINGNPAVSQAVNGTNVADGFHNLSEITRWMAANMTTRSPTFVLSNFARDYLFASSILGVKENLTQLGKNYPLYVVKCGGIGCTPSCNIPNSDAVIKYWF